MWDYYTQAVQRSFWAGWYWAVGQGLWLTFWIAVAATASELLRRLYGHRNQPSERHAIVKDLGKTALVDLAGTALLFIIAIFLWFFVNDAPDQNRLAKEQARSALSASTAEINRLNGEIARLSAELAKRNVKGFFVECHVGSSIKINSSGRAYAISIFDQQYIQMSEFSGAPTLHST